MKKIIFDGRFLSLGHAGIGRYSCEILKELLKLDRKNNYVILVKKIADLDNELIESIRSSKADLIETEILHYSITEQTSLPKMLEGLEPDLVHFPHFNHPIFYKGQFVSTIHDLTLSYFTERRGLVKQLIYDKVIADSMKRSKKILTVSQFVKDDLIKHYNRDPKDIAVTYNAIDEKFTKQNEEKVTTVKEKYKLKKPYILSVGQWRTHKNLLRLLEAFKKVLEKNEFIELAFAGREDPRYTQIREKISELGIEQKVIMTGFVDDEDLPGLYQGASVFVFPSLSEGFGLPGLEAQRCGVPVAASRATCFPEIYAQGAAYFDPHSVDDMAKVIDNVLNDAKLRNELVIKGLENTKRFSWKDSALKTLEVYQEVLYNNQRKN